LTEVLAEFPGDAHFPAIDPHDWRETAREEHISDTGLHYRFLTLERIRS
jgi:dihydrofolate reductase